MLTQLRKGVLDYLVLNSLIAAPQYGLALARRLEDSGLIASEGTLYPILTRLRERGWVDTHWQESSAGPPRRYYELTKTGRGVFEDFLSTWQTFKELVDTEVSQSE